MSHTEQHYWTNGEERVAYPLPERVAPDPRTFYESLMVTVGKGEPPPSLEERQPLREAVQRCVDTFRDRDRKLIEAYFFEGLGYRGAARRAGLSRMTAYRRLQSLAEVLRVRLLDEPLVRERVGYVHAEEAE